MPVQRFGAIDVVDVGSAGFTAIANTVTRTVLWPGKVATVIPAYDMRAGKKYVLDACGIISHTAAPTMIWDPLIGVNGTTGDVTLGVSPTVAAPVGTTIANVPWYLHFVLGVVTVGIAVSTAKVFGTGFVTVAENATTTTGMPLIVIGGVTTVTTVDQTGANYLDVAFTWGTSSASNSIQCIHATLETRN